jgi:hypothetical protein
MLAAQRDLATARAAAARLQYGAMVARAARQALPARHQPQVMAAAAAAAVLLRVALEGPGYKVLL